MLTKKWQNLEKYCHRFLLMETIQEKNNVSDSLLGKNTNKSLYNVGYLSCSGK